MRDQYHGWCAQAEVADILAGVEASSAQHSVVVFVSGNWYDARKVNEVRQRHKRFNEKSICLRYGEAPTLICSSQNTASPIGGWHCRREAQSTVSYRDASTTQVTVILCVVAVSAVN